MIHRGDTYTCTHVTDRKLFAACADVQVTSQLGLVLDITYPDMFQALMELFKPFVDFFRTLSIMYDMECLDLGDHTTKWMVKVVVMPSVLLLGASLHYMYMVHKKMPTAFMQLKSTFFFIVFFICK